MGSSYNQPDAINSHPHQPPIKSLDWKDGITAGDFIKGTLFSSKIGITIDDQTGDVVILVSPEMFRIYHGFSSFH